jgi:peptidoglycan/LPS O-acetylase OafA/YrhL
MPTTRPEFRPDLEGLRGVAILLVVLFHAGVPGLAGGFVGVDVFFVLSGFFITGLLVREVARDAGVDLPAFYGRRALRLLPPLVVVLAATLATVMWLYAPIDRAAIAASARSVALSSGNVEFARGAVDYFSAGENPLLHTWSLAVEEQFYLVWPLLVVLLVALAARRRPDAATGAGAPGEGVRPTLLVGLAVAGVLSFAAALWLTRASPPWAFFGTPARLWEFALGGVLAVAVSGPAATASTTTAAPRVGALLQGAGLLAIGVSVALYDSATPYPWHRRAAARPRCSRARGGRSAGARRARQSCARRAGARMVRAAIVRVVPVALAAGRARRRARSHDRRPRAARLVGGGAGARGADVPVRRTAHPRRPPASGARAVGAGHDTGGECGRGAGGARRDAGRRAARRPPRPAAVRGSARGPDAPRLLGHLGRSRANILLVW